MDKITLPQFLSENYVSEWDKFAVSKMDNKVLKTSKEWYASLCGLINLSKVQDKYVASVSTVTDKAVKVETAAINVAEEVKNGVSEIVDNLKKNK